MRTSGVVTATMDLDEKDRLIEEQQAEIQSLRSQLYGLTDNNSIPSTGYAASVPMSIVDNNDETVASILTSTTTMGNGGGGGGSIASSYVPPCYWVEEMPWTVDMPDQQMPGSFTGNVSRDYNVPYGRGTLVFVNGDVYRGPFHHGEMHGTAGAYQFSDDGSVYQGSFWHNLMHGQGHYQHPDYEYVGAYEYGQPHGSGIRYNKDKTIYHNGRWVYGKPSKRSKDADYAVALDEDQKHSRLATKARKHNNYNNNYNKKKKSKSVYSNDYNPKDDNDDDDEEEDDQDRRPEADDPLVSDASETDRSIYDSGDDYEDLVRVGFHRELSVKSLKRGTPTIPESEVDTD